MLSEQRIKTLPVPPVLGYTNDASRHQRHMGSTDSEHSGCNAASTRYTGIWKYNGMLLSATITLQPMRDFCGGMGIYSASSTVLELPTAEVEEDDWYTTQFNCGKTIQPVLGDQVCDLRSDERIPANWQADTLRDYGYLILAHTAIMAMIGDSRASLCASDCEGQDGGTERVLQIMEKLEYVMSTKVFIMDIGGPGTTDVTSRHIHDRPCRLFEGVDVRITRHSTHNVNSGNDVFVAAGSVFVEDYMGEHYYDPEYDCVVCDNDDRAWKGDDLFKQHEVRRGDQWSIPALHYYPRGWQTQG